MLQHLQQQSVPGTLARPCMPTLTALRLFGSLSRLCGLRFRDQANELRVVQHDRYVAKHDARARLGAGHRREATRAPLRSPRLRGHPMQEKSKMLFLADMKSRSRQDPSRSHQDSVKNETPYVDMSPSQSWASPKPLRSPNPPPRHPLMFTTMMILHHHARMGNSRSHGLRPKPALVTGAYIASRRSRWHMM